jgi:predicted phage terminase large subunit-like protein
MESGRFEHLNLPAIAVDDESIATGFGLVKSRRKGEPLCPEREPITTLEQVRVEMGSAAFSAQYQQDPTPPGGNRIRWEWFGTYDEEFSRSDFQWVAQSWDTALTAEPTSDFSVGTTCGFREKRWYPLDLCRERFDFPDLKRRVRHLAERWKADAVLIERAASGIPLFQQLRQEDPRSWRYFSRHPRLEKVTRMEAQTARLESGRYLLPSDARWLTDFRRELLAFPKGKYDDQVDSLIQFVEWSASPRGEGFVERDETGRPLRVYRPESVMRC